MEIFFHHVTCFGSTVMWVQWEHLACVYIHTYSGVYGELGISSYYKLHTSHQSECRPFSILLTNEGSQRDFQTSLTFSAGPVPRRQAGRFNACGPSLHTLSNYYESTRRQNTIWEGEIIESNLRFTRSILRQLRTGISHPSTAQRCLASGIVRELVFPCWCPAAP